MLCIGRMTYCAIAYPLLSSSIRLQEVNCDSSIGFNRTSRVLVTRATPLQEATVRRLVIRFGLLSAIAMLAVTAPRTASASNAMACNVSYGGNFCDDVGYLRYFCNAVCPGWTLAVCYEGTITCSKDPD
jgi:hypothetical protein